MRRATREFSSHWELRFVISAEHSVAIPLVDRSRACFPGLLRQVAPHGITRTFHAGCPCCRTGNRIWLGRSYFGVSYALGAFFAGMVLHESDLSHKAATNSLPLQDAFAVLFFLSVGMLFDPLDHLARALQGRGGDGADPGRQVFGGIGNRALARLCLSTALTVSASLAQIGEFSFILSELGISYGLMTPEGLNLILAGALLSIHPESSRFLRRGTDDPLDSCHTETELPL